MADYKLLKYREFIKFINSTLKKRLTKLVDFQNEKDKVDVLLSQYNGNLTGKLFFDIIEITNEDLDNACDKLFYDHKWDVLKGDKENSTKLDRFLSGYTYSEATIAKRAGIEKSYLNRVKNSHIEDLYAYEVYGLAKAFGLKPSQLFNYFYGDGERPVVGIEV